MAPTPQVNVCRDHFCVFVSLVISICLVLRVFVCSCYFYRQIDWLARSCVPFTASIRRRTSTHSAAIPTPHLPTVTAVYSQADTPHTHPFAVQPPPPARLIFIMLSCMLCALQTPGQVPVLFTGSIRENLAPFGGHSDAALWSALRRAHLAPVVEDWEQSGLGGLDYQLGEGGSPLSAGQKQLLALARALLNPAKVGAVRWQFLFCGLGGG